MQFMASMFKNSINTLEVIIGDLPAKAVALVKEGGVYFIKKNCCPYGIIRVLGKFHLWIRSIAYE
jgi:hypothetical protein